MALPSLTILADDMAVRKREEEVLPNAAGIDVGALSLWVADQHTEKGVRPQKKTTRLHTELLHSGVAKSLKNSAAYEGFSVLHRSVASKTLSGYHCVGANPDGGIKTGPPVIDCGP